MKRVTEMTPKGIKRRKEVSPSGMYLFREHIFWNRWDGMWLWSDTAWTSCVPAYVFPKVKDKVVEISLDDLKKLNPYAHAEVLDWQAEQAAIARAFDDLKHGRITDAELKNKTEEYHVLILAELVSK